MRRLASPHRCLALASFVALALGSALTAIALGAAGQTYVSARYHYSLPVPAGLKLTPAKTDLIYGFFPSAPSPEVDFFGRANMTREGSPSHRSLPAGTTLKKWERDESPGDRSAFQLPRPRATSDQARRHSCGRARLRARPATATSTRSKSSTAAAVMTSTGSARSPPDRRTRPGSTPTSRHFASLRREPARSAPGSSRYRRSTASRRRHCPGLAFMPIRATAPLRTVTLLGPFQSALHGYECLPTRAGKADYQS